MNVVDKDLDIDYTQVYVLTINGHRPNVCYSYNYDDYVWCDFSDYVSSYVKEIFKEVRSQGKKLIVVTGGALGIDQKAALEVLRLKALGFPIELWVCVPCRGYEARWVDSSRVLFRELLEKADKVIFVSKDEYEPGCLDERNHYMVNISNSLLSFCLNTDTGTYKTIRYARKHGIVCTVIDPLTFEVRKDI